MNGIQLNLYTPRQIALLSLVNQEVCDAVRPALHRAFQWAQTKKVHKVYSLFRPYDAGGSGEGFTGSLVPSTVFWILNSLPGGIEGKRVFDCGCGHGRFMLAAMVLKACSAYGLDLYNNLPVFFPPFQAVRNHLGIKDTAANICFSDITKIKKIPGDPHLVYTFWDSMQANVRDWIIWLVTQSDTAQAFACTNVVNESPERVLYSLNETDNINNFKTFETRRVPTIGRRITEEQIEALKTVSQIIL